MAQLGRTGVPLKTLARWVAVSLHSGEGSCRQEGQPQHHHPSWRVPNAGHRAPDPQPRTISNSLTRLLLSIRSTDLVHSRNHLAIILQTLSKSWEAGTQDEQVTCAVFRHLSSLVRLFHKRSSAVSENPSPFPKHPWRWGNRAGTGGEETFQAPGKGFISPGEGGQIVCAYACVCVCVCVEPVQEQSIISLH